MLQGIICCIGIILFIRMYRLHERDFKDHPCFARARGRYLWAYSFFALGMGIPILLACCWRFFYDPQSVRTLEDLRALTKLADTINIFSAVCYLVSLIGGVFCHLAAQNIDPDKMLYLAASGQATRGKTDIKDLLKKTDRFS